MVQQRTVQQRARALAKAEGIKYTQALRRIEHEQRARHVTNDDDLPGMWSHVDFTGGDTDGRSYVQRIVDGARAKLSDAASVAVFDALDTALRPTRATSSAGSLYGDYLARLTTLVGPCASRTEVYEAFTAEMANTAFDGPMPPQIVDSMTEAVLAALAQHPPVCERCGHDEANARRCPLSDKPAHAPRRTRSLEPTGPTSDRFRGRGRDVPTGRGVRMRHVGGNSVEFVATDDGTATDPSYYLSPGSGWRIEQVWHVVPDDDATAAPSYGLSPDSGWGIEQVWHAASPMPEQLGGREYAGVRLIELDDAWTVAVGHIEPAEFARAHNEMTGAVDTSATGHVSAESVEHRWAVVSTPAPVWTIEFGPEVTERTPGAFPITAVG